MMLESDCVWNTSHRAFFAVATARAGMPAEIAKSCGMATANRPPLDWLVAWVVLVSETYFFLGKAVPDSPDVHVQWSGGLINWNHRLNMTNMSSIMFWLVMWYVKMCHARQLFKGRFSLWPLSVLWFCQSPRVPFPGIPETSKLLTFTKRQTLNIWFNDLTILHKRTYFEGKQKMKQHHFTQFRVKHQLATGDGTASDPLNCQALATDQARFKLRLSKKGKGGKLHRWESQGFSGTVNWCQVVFFPQILATSRTSY